MTNEQIEEQLGTWEIRQERTKQIAEQLQVFLREQGIVLNDSVFHFRAKTNESIQHKLSRFNESLHEVLDLYGIRIVCVDMVVVEHVAKLLSTSFGDALSDQEMLIRGGTMIFPAYRDYRKRDWPGVSPATSSGYLDAIHLNRKSNGHIFEVQIMTQDLFAKYCSLDGDVGHTQFKERQKQIFKK